MKNHAIKSGVMIGVIGIIITLLLYIVDPTTFAKWWLMMLLGVLNLTLIAVFGVKYRNEIGGFMSFKDAYVYSLITMVVMVLVGTLFSIVMFNVVDPGISETVADAVAENTESMMRNFGAPEDGMDEAIDKARADTLDRFTMVGMIKGAGIRILINVVFCLILGAIIKKNEPELEG
ncbi:DUF4199 domain-containing protein [Ekhidna sp.]|uniref:DUF4199 domain-containing protein n=1 Tax=Ekhidna sp. TaxID=2608089 RepID=UPI003513E790